MQQWDWSQKRYAKRKQGYPLHNLIYVTPRRDNIASTAKSRMFGEDRYHEGTPGDVTGGGNGL